MAVLGSLELLAAGFSASFGVTVLPPGGSRYEECSEAPQKLTVHDLFHISHSMVPKEMPPSTANGEMEVVVRGLTGATVMIRVNLGTTIAEVKTMIIDKLNIKKEIKLMFDRRVLEDENTVDVEGIQNGTTINYLVLNADRKSGVFELDPSLLARNYDHDFTNKRDGNDVYMRGQYRYYRPCGWYRYAVAVINVYENNTWLGPNGIRTSTSPGEWPVSYHGTKMRDRGEVVQTFRGSEQPYVQGVYSSPSLPTIEAHYAQEFEFEGKRYKFALQNRINPDKARGHMKIIPKNMTEVGADYWISPMENPAERIFDVRPYGIIIKQV